MFSHICQHCGKHFEGAERTRKFCSKQCADAHKSTITGPDHPLYRKQKRSCRICGTEFEYVPSTNDRQCCSFKCASEMKAMHAIWDVENEFDAPIETILYDLYITQRLSTREIISILRVGNHTLLRWLDDYSIPKRKGGEAVKTQWENNPERRKRQSENIKSKIESGRMDRYRLVTFSRTETGRRKIAESKTGSNNPMYGKFGELNAGWTGGKVTYRGKGWLSAREQARRRDGYKCQKCGATKHLEVHHIVPYRLTQDNSLDNLITLCHTCHEKVEHGKDTLPARG